MGTYTKLAQMKPMLVTTGTQASQDSPLSPTKDDTTKPPTQKTEDRETERRDSISNTPKQESPERDVQDIPPVRHVPPVHAVPPVRSKRRPLKHHPFNIYEDQLDTLHQMKYEAMLKGIEKSMASMVREALDRYIEENR